MIIVGYARLPEKNAWLLDKDMQSFYWLDWSE